MRGAVPARHRPRAGAGPGAVDERGPDGWLWTASWPAPSIGRARAALDYVCAEQSARIDFARSQTATESDSPGPDRPRARLLRSRSPDRVGPRASVRAAGTRRLRQLKTTGARARSGPGSRAGDNGLRAPHNRRHIHGSRDHAPAARERRPLRAPDPSLEPQDEALHHDRAQRHLHHRPAAVAGLHRPLLRLHQGDRRQGRHRDVRRHQEAGPGGDRRAGDPRRHALRQPALARRHAHQLPDRAPADQPPQGARRDRLRRRGRLRPHQEGAAADASRARQARTRPSAASAR